MQDLPDIQYYLIHGLDLRRRPYIERQFKKFGIPSAKVKWILKPNKDDPLPHNICSAAELTTGQIAVTYKHYLALKDIAVNRYPLAVIMEDNIRFRKNVPITLQRYLQDLPTDWGCVFDSDLSQLHYIEGPVSPDKSVYLKSNEVTQQCGGGSRGANFIFLNLNAATRMYEKFLPFNKVSDHYYNELLRDLNIQSHWSEPPNVHKIPRPSSWKDQSDLSVWKKLREKIMSILHNYI